MLANAAFYFGLVRTLADADRPVWSQLPFSRADQNFRAACRYGLAARLTWPRVGELGAADLVRDHLLELADQGLVAFGVDTTIRDRLLGVIAGRCATGQTGAAWQTATVQRLESTGATRTAALAGMLDRYVELQSTNEPIHTWPVD